MTDRIIKQQAIRRLRHPSEEVVVDRIGRRRNRQQAFKEEGATGIPPVRLLNLYLSAALLWFVLFAWMLSQPPGVR